MFIWIVVPNSSVNCLVKWCHCWKITMTLFIEKNSDTVNQKNGNVLFGALNFKDIFLRALNFPPFRWICRFRLHSYNLQKRMYYVHTCGTQLLKYQKPVLLFSRMTLLQVVQVCVSLIPHWDRQTDTTIIELLNQTDLSSFNPLMAKDALLPYL